MRRIHRSHWEREQYLDRNDEREPRPCVRGPRNPTEYNEQARENVALTFGGFATSTDEGES